MVPALANQSLLSGNKFAQADYVTICDNKEVNIYDGQTAKIVVPEEAVLKGWFCPKSRMWRIPLQPHIINNNTDTLLLNGPTVTESLNTTYTVPNSSHILQHIKTCCDYRPAPDEAINNVYELPSTYPTIRYLHGAAVFPTKATWLKAIRKGNYQSWPLVNSKNVNIFSRNQRRHKRGTCVANAKADVLPKKKRLHKKQWQHKKQQTK